MTPKQQFAKRLRAAMKRAGLEDSITELQLVFNRRTRGKPVSVQAAFRWFHGQSMPRHDSLLVLADVLSIDPSELEYGVKSPATAAEGQSWEKLATYPDREAVEAFVNLPLKERTIVREVILTFAKASRKG
jgi:hypothetical protein